MKVILFGATGAIGTQVQKALETSGHEVIGVGRKTGRYQADMGDRESLRKLYQTIGSFDAVVSAAGEVAFAPLERLGAEEWKRSLEGKFLGQVQLVQEAIPYIREKGSFTLVSGILADEPIVAGAAATAVNRAIEGFALAAAIELPKGLRINVVSPTVLEESMKTYGPFFPGFIPVPGAKVAQAFLKSILGAQTGEVYRVF
ncbi:MAG: short chain dehydrogenase [Bdellovibrionia bacterium]